MGQQLEDLMEMVHSLVTATLQVSSGHLYLSIFSTVTTCTSITSATTYIASISHQEKLPALLHTAGSFLTNFLSSGCETQALLSAMNFAGTFTHFCPTILSKKRQHQAAVTNLAKPSRDDQTHQGKTGDRK